MTFAGTIGVVAFQAKRIDDGYACAIVFHFETETLRNGSSEVSLVSPSAVYVWYLPVSVCLYVCMFRVNCVFPFFLPSVYPDRSFLKFVLRLVSFKTALSFEYTHTLALSLFHSLAVVL